MNRRGCALGVIQIALVGCAAGLLTLVCVGGAFWSEGLVGPGSLSPSNKPAAVQPVQARPVAYAMGDMPATPKPLSNTPAAAPIVFTPSPVFTPSALPPAPVEPTASLATPTLEPSPVLSPAPLSASSSVPVTPLLPPPSELTSGSGLPQRQATRLVIPSLGLDTPVVLAPIEGETWRVDHLTQEVGHLEGTSSPGSGSNVVLAGHITLEPDGRDGPFIGLGYLDPGDSVIVYHRDQPYTYQVDYMTTVKPTDVQVTYPSTEARLTLITCLNFDRSLARYTDRLVVVGHLVDGPPAN